MNQDPSLHIEIKLSEANTVLNALGEMPYKTVRPLIDSILAQAHAQLNPAPAPAPAAPQTQTPSAAEPAPQEAPAQD